MGVRLLEVLGCWRDVVIRPERVRGGRFSLGFMLVVSFYLGFLYNTFHYFLYPVYTVEEFHAGLFFWLHSLFGGAAAAGMLLYVSAIGYFGCLVLGKRVSYSRIEHLVFASSFLWLLPLLLSPLLIGLGVEEPVGKVKEVRLFGDWFYVTWAVLLSAPVASLLTFRVFRRALGFDTLRSLLPAALILPLGYIVGKGSFMFPFRGLLSLEEEERMVAGILYFSLMGFLFYYVRKKREGVERVLFAFLRRLGFQSSRSRGVGRQERRRP
ncbi:MAG: hypothetical protein QXM46_04030 [Candidatus Hadarchaeales archaeon]